MSQMTEEATRQLIREAIPNTLLYQHLGVYLDWLALDTCNDAVYRLSLEFKSMRQFGCGVGWGTKRHLTEAWCKLHQGQPQQRLDECVYELERDLRILLAEILQPTGPNSPAAASFAHAAGYGIRIAHGLKFKDMLK